LVFGGTAISRNLIQSAAHLCCDTTHRIRGTLRDSALAGLCADSDNFAKENLMLRCAWPAR